MDLSRWETPTEVSDVDIAFPARGAELTPDYDALPPEFRNGSDPWCHVAENAFHGRHGDLMMSIRPGIDFDKAARHLQCVMGTYATKHEHKIAGAAYLLSRWFKIAESE